MSEHPTQDRIDAYSSFDLSVTPGALLAFACGVGFVWMVASVFTAAMGG